jgi:hypothetical protein
VSRLEALEAGVVGRGGSQGRLCMLPSATRRLRLRMDRLPDLGDWNRRHKLNRLLRTHSVALVRRLQLRDLVLPGVPRAMESGEWLPGTSFFTFPSLGLDVSPEPNHERHSTALWRAWTDSSPWDHTCRIVIREAEEEREEERE